MAIPYAARYIFRYISNKLNTIIVMIIIYLYDMLQWISNDTFFKNK